MTNAMDRIWAARAHVLAAKREAQAALNAYAAQEDKRTPPVGKYAHGIRAANRISAAGHLPDDMLQVLGIDRYNVKTR